MMSNGGKRPGAGRKPLQEPKVGITVKIDPLLRKFFNADCRAKGISQAKQVEIWIRETPTT